MEYRVIHTVSEAQELAYELPSIISLDTEYSELNVRKAELLSISIGLSDNKAAIIRPHLLRYISESLKSRKIIFMQNFVVDYYMLAKNGCELINYNILDVMLMHHLIDENAEHSLGYMANKYFQDNYKQEFWDKYESFAVAETEDSNQYEMRDAVYTYRLGMQFLQQFDKRLELVNHVHRLAFSLMQTEVLGLRVNEDLIRRTRDETKQKIEGYEQRLRDEFSGACLVWENGKWEEEKAKRKTDKGKQGVRKPVFSFTSASQVSWLVYNYLNAPVIEKTKKGSPSTSFDTIKELSKQIPELGTLVEYKDTRALYEIFMEGLLERVESGRIYPRFNINGTTTGRISHSNPNMGNMPRDGVVRNFFIPEPGNVIIGADYSQLEVIVEANLTEDKNLLSIILDGASKHDITAEGLGLSRDQAKTLNFALQYGAGINKVSKILDISYRDAEEVFEQYWALYNGVKQLKNKTDEMVLKNQPIVNIFGRERHFADKFDSKYELEKAKRQAYNFLIQGTGADITNRAFYLWHEYLKRTGRGRSWFHVHDECVGETRPEIAEDEKQALVKIMEGVTQYVKFKYPLLAASYGPFDKWQKG